MEGYKINDTLWPSKEEFDNFKNHVLPKLKELIDRGYSVEWDWCSNWVKVTKYIGEKKYRGVDHKLRTKIFCEAKVFTTPSTFGIDNGRISKMGIRIRPDYPNRDYCYQLQKRYFGYDRGEDFDKVSKNKDAQKMYDTMIELFN